MKKQLYPNGDHVEYTYDKLDRNCSEVYTNQNSARKTEGEDARPDSIFPQMGRAAAFRCPTTVDS